MPRYYFHIKDGVDLPDNEGSEFADLDSARSEAVRLSGEILQEGHTSSLWQGQPWQLQVTDGPLGQGRLLFTLNFSAVEAAEALARSDSPADA
jgi:hypothetical protein